MYSYNYIVRRLWTPIIGYAWSAIWNGWHEGSHRLVGVETAPAHDDGSAAYSFAVTGVPAIYSFDVVFTITGVEDY
jgi:hypothetical protein